MHLPEVEARPEEERDDGKGQAEGEVYLDGVEVGVGIALGAGLEDVGAHERLERKNESLAVSFFDGGPRVREEG